MSVFDDRADAARRLSQRFMRYRGEVLYLWQHSHDQCDPEPVETHRYIRQHLDLLFKGLLEPADASRFETRRPTADPSRKSRSKPQHGKPALHRE